MKSFNSFTFFSFNASQVKQHKLENHTFCNFLNVTLSWLAVTAYNIQTQKPVTRAGERRTQCDQPLMTPRMRRSPSLIRTDGPIERDCCQ